ncbi:MAG: class II glutamine amidotransferase [Aquabacterium sp.]
MCRFIAYHGQAIFLEELIAKPQHSLVRQSLRAEEARTVTNGDGFGIGWYGEREEPAVYREVMPAWSDDNLQSLAATVRSRLFFAHVRAATSGGIARSNCHPFRHGRWMFMHNGQIGGYARVRRALEARLPDGLYAQRRGATDSELLFLLTLARIDAGEAPADAVQQVFDAVVRLMHERGVTEPLRLAAALTDGRRMHAFRLSSDAHPPTLYRCQGPQGLVVASEPLKRDDDRDAEWLPLAHGEAVSAAAVG